MTAELIELYREMHELTLPICASGKDECQSPYRCCERRYCEQARQRARTAGVSLVDTGHAELPFMGEAGCIVPPHLRPTCTLHICTISFAAQSHVEHDPEKLKAYLALRKKIETLEREG